MRNTWASICIILCIVIHQAIKAGRIAVTFKDEGNKEYRKGNYYYAIVCYTEGINENCGNKNINAKLFLNRATAQFYLGKNCSFFVLFVLYQSSLTFLV